MVFAAPVLASAGDRAGLARLRAVLPDHSPSGTDARDAAMVAVALAAADVAAHDETAAAARIEAYLAAHGLDHPAGSLALRRFLPYGYVLSAAARAAWDAQDLGPSHRRARDVARLLLAARGGALAPADTLPGADAIVGALALPWAVELVARAQEAGHPGAAGGARRARRPAR